MRMVKPTPLPAARFAALQQAVGLSRARMPELRSSWALACFGDRSCLCTSISQRSFPQRKDAMLLWYSKMPTKSSLTSSHAERRRKGAAR